MKNKEDALSVAKALQAKKDDKKILGDITQILNEIGVPAHLSGYEYLRRAIYMAYFVPDLVHQITKALYPALGLFFDAKASQCERGMRHALIHCWDRGFPEIKLYFGRLNSKPANSEFIATIVNHLKYIDR